MPEGVGYGPQNTASTGLKVNTIGNHAYAMSGLVGVDNNETNLINTTTGNYYWKVKVMFSYAVEGSQGDNMIYRVKMNGIVTWLHQSNNSTVEFQQPNVLHFIVPPYTFLECTAINATDATTQNQLVVLAGRIYK